MFVTDESWKHPRGVPTRRKGVLNRWVCMCPHQALFLFRRVKRGVLRVDLPAGIVRGGARLYEVTQELGEKRSDVRMLWGGQVTAVAELYIQRPEGKPRPTRYGYREDRGAVKPIPPDVETFAPDDYVDAACCGVFTSPNRSKPRSWW